MRASQVEVVFVAKHPQHYLARLGEGGWCEGWGWTEADALDDLARVVHELRPVEQVPVHVLGDRRQLTAWLRRHAPQPVLDA